MPTSAPSATGTETLRQRYNARLGNLKNDRQNYEPMWRDIDRYILPDRCQFDLESNHNRTDTTAGFNYIIDASATTDIRTSAAGLHSSITSPVRKWFDINIADQDLQAIPHVSAWLEDCRDRILDGFRTSNLYNVLPITYGNCIAFGIDAIIMEEDDEDIFRFENLALGTYWVSTNAKRRVDTIFRRLEMSVRQVVEKFKLENVTETTKAKWNQGDRESTVCVMHCVTPNEEYDPNGIFSWQKKYASKYWEENSQDDEWLSEKGFDTFPAMVPRWEVTGRNVYGQGPGKLILGDVKALQAYERRSAEAVAKMNTPPMLAPSSMEGLPISQVPGGITYYDENAANGKVSSLYERGMFDIQGVELKANQCRARIHAGSFAELFLMISSSDRRQVTAEEIKAKQEEKILQIGPPLENLNDDLLDMIVARAFFSMLDRGMLPPPPEEVQGHKLVIQYQSTLAQVQKLLGVGALDRFLATVRNIAGFKPEALDNIDVDQTVQEYHEMLGPSHRVLVDPDERDKLRSQRAQMAAQQHNQQMAEQQANTAQTLSQTPTDGDTALTSLISAASGQAA